MEPELRVSDSSLDAAIRGAASPSMAASLRIVDQARQKVLDNRPDDAIRLLTYALSADPADSYAYFYLGRSWLVKKNYPQAMTFLKRAEIGLSSNPRWLSETLAFEGLTHEESGNAAAAEAAYRLALKAAPGNLMARVGYTRLAAGPAGEATPSPGEASPEAAEPAGAPSASEVTPPPEESPPAAPPPEEFPAAAPTSEEILAPPPAEAPSAN